MNLWVSFIMLVVGASWVWKIVFLYEKKFDGTEDDSNPEDDEIYANEKEKARFKALRRYYAKENAAGGRE